MDKPIFGEKKQFADHQVRYAAYIVIGKDQQIAVTRAPNGAFFLPGGEIEGDETKEEVVVRELIEEMGTAAEITLYLGEADEYFYPSYHTTYYYNPGYFSATDSWKCIGEPIEKTSKIWWISPREAPDRSKCGSRRWAVERWIEKNNK